MLKFNTQAMFLNRLFSHEQVFKAISPLPNGLKTGLLAAFLCCFSFNLLHAQCTNPDVAAPNAVCVGTFQVAIGGTGTVDLFPVQFDNGSTDNCGITSMTVSPSSVDCGNVGPVPVTLTVSDAAGNLDDCLTIIDVVDNLTAVVGVASTVPMPLEADDNACSRLVESGTIVAVIIDNCLEEVSYTIGGGPDVIVPIDPSGQYTLPNTIFDVGTTTVTWSAESTNGVVVTGSVDVIIEDDEDPEITCPANMTGVSTDAGDCHANVTYTAPVGTDNCPGAMTTRIAGPMSGGEFPAETTTTVTYEVEDASGNTATCSFTVEVVDDETPTLGTPVAPLPAASGGTISFSPPVECFESLTLDVGGALDNCPDSGPATAFVSWQITKTSVMPNEVTTGTGVINMDFYGGTYEVVFTANDENGNTGETYMVTVIVQDAQPPMAVCQDVTVSLDSNGDVTVNAVDLDGGSTDNCPPLDSFSIRLNGGDPWVGSLDFDCTDIGAAIPVRFRVWDSSLNSNADNSCEITIEDNTPPNALCQNITVDLANGIPQEVFASDIDNGSNDACGLNLNFPKLREGTSTTGGFPNSATAVMFDCGDLGDNDVVLRVRDIHGNTNHCSAIVTVIDTEDPDAICVAPFSIQLDANGDASITAADVNNVSTDNCGIASTSIDMSNFDCSDLGDNTVTLTVTDVENNTDQCTTTVTVEDMIAPNLTCPANDTIYLDNQGEYNLVALDLADPIAPGAPGQWADDNCTIVSAQLRVPPFGGFFATSWEDDITFDCGDIGGNTVRFRAEDQSTNLASFCTVNLEVLDTLAPTAACTSFSVGLNPDGTVDVAGSQVGIASQDNCTIFLFLDRQIALDEDMDGNPDDPFAPFFTFDCAHVGPNNVLVQVTDGSGNSGYCNGTVTITDLLDPLVTCPPAITINCEDDRNDLSLTGDVVFTPDNMPMPGPQDGSATDNCEVISADYMDGSNYSVSCPNEYVFDRTWTVSDNMTPTANTTTCVQTITVVDDEAPTFFAPADAKDIELTCANEGLFSTMECVSEGSSITTPIAIPTGAAGFIEDEITIAADGKITDVNLTGLVLQHTDVSEISVTLYAPDGTPVLVYDENCGGTNIDDVNFDDDGAPLNCSNLSGGNTYAPTVDALADFDGLQLNGVWTLRIDYTGSGNGNLIDWGLDICYVTNAADPDVNPMAANLVGVATGLGDNCSATADLDADFTDYHAFKGFAENTANTPGATTTYDFSCGEWSISAGFGNVCTGNSMTLNSGVTPGSCSDNTVEYPSHVLNDGWIAFDYSSQNDDGDLFSYSVDGGAPVALTLSSMKQRAVVRINDGDSFSFILGCNGNITSTTVLIENFIYLSEDISPYEVVPSSGPICNREFCIARVWTLTDDCGNTSAPQVQVITTQDSQAPSLDPIPMTLDFNTDMDECLAVLDLDYTGMIDDNGCGVAMVWNNGPYGDGMADISGSYPPGTYNILFETEDECGNYDSKTLVLNVVDNQAPQAICQDVTTSLSGGLATVPASSVDNGSFDNCTNISFSPTEFIYNTAGSYDVVLTVTDDEGNDATCDATITVLSGVAVTFEAGDANGNTGEQVTFPVTVSNFNDVGGFSFKINLGSAAVATIAPSPGMGSVMNVIPDVASLSHNATSTTTVEVVWIGSSTNIGDGTTIFDVQVQLQGAPGDVTPVTITDVSALSGVGNPLTSQGLDGTVSVLNAANPITISGTLLTPNQPVSCTADPVDMVTVEITPNVSTPSSPFPNSSAGFYTSTVPQGSSPTIEPGKDVNWSNGVNILDVNTIIDHFLDIQLMTSGYQMIAADASGNGTIGIEDIFAINQMIFGTPADGNTSWNFVNPNTFAPAAITSGNRLMVPAYDDFRSYANVQANITDADFVGVKTGDLNCDANALNFTGNGAVTDGSGGGLPFMLENKSAKAGDDVLVVFKSNDFEDLIGYQFTLDFDQSALQFEAFIPLNLVNLSEANVSSSRIDEGLLATTWFNMDAVSMTDDEELFAIKFKALADFDALRELLHASSEYIDAMAVKANKSVIDVDVVFEELTSTAGEAFSTNGFALLQNQPNPFSSTTTIGFVLPENGSATLSFMDAAGRTLKVIEGDYAAGYQQVQIERHDLPTNGIVLYRLETAGHTAVRKMMLID